MSIYFTKDHEWIRVEGNKAILGITDYASKQLGDITFISLPSEGNDIKQGDILCELESVKAASDIYSPLSGIISKANNVLNDTPELINSSPHESGWIAEIEISESGQINALMSEQQYKDYLNTLE